MSGQDKKVARRRKRNRTRGTGTGTGGGAGSVAAARRAQTHTGWWWAGGGIAVIVALIVVLAVNLSGKSPSQAGAGPTTIPTSPISTATGSDTPPPWPVPADVTASVHQAGLPMLGSEGSVEHIHVHLDIIANGQAVTVPALIGIDEQHSAISPLHTHDATGVIHIESPTQATFSLAQFFTEWHVALSAEHIGGLTVGPGNTLRAYVNGTQVNGDPAAITFHGHDEIALVYGPPTQNVPVPGSYNWTQGL